MRNAYLFQPAYGGEHGDVGEGDVVSLLFCFVVVYSTFRENIGVVLILGIKTQFFTIKVLGIDDEGLGPRK